jgi:hypothetical protein
MGEDPWVGDDGEGRWGIGAPKRVEPTPSALLRLQTSAQVYDEAAGHRVMLWRNMLLTQWFAPVTEAGLTASEAGSFELAAQHPRGVAVFNVIEYGLKLPDAAARRKASSVVRATAGHVRAATTVVPGEGFWASSARAAVATITLLSGAAHPHKVFATLEKGRAFIRPYVDPEPVMSLEMDYVLQRLGAPVSAGSVGEPHSRE